MRVTTSMLALVALVTGCEYQPGALQHESTLYTAARGVALHEAGTRADEAYMAQVGMNRTTCAVDTQYASIGTDYDYTDGAEEVQDVGIDTNGDVTVVVTSDKGVHMQRDPSGGADPWGGTVSTDIDLDGVTQARLFEDGAFVITEDAGGCDAHVVGTRDDWSLGLRPDHCEGVYAIDTDPAGGLAWVGSDAGLFQVTPNQVTVVSDQPANLVAYDPYTDALYTAEIGGSVVSAIESDGTVRWTQDLGGTIVSLDDMGAQEQVAVSLTWADGTGALLFLDGWTGLEANQVQMAGNPGRVETSRDGRKLALIGTDRVDFYEVGTGGTTSSVDWGAVLDGLSGL